MFNKVNLLYYYIQTGLQQDTETNPRKISGYEDGHGHDQDGFAFPVPFLDVEINDFFYSNTTK